MTATASADVYTAQGRLACGTCTTADERDAFGAQVMERRDVARLRPLTRWNSRTDCCGSAITADQDGYVVTTG